jgi:hypothetical protein
MEIGTAIIKTRHQPEYRNKDLFPRPYKNPLPFLPQENHSMPPCFVRIIFLSLLSLTSFAHAKPLSSEQVPEPLKPWTAWVLNGHEERLCPSLPSESESGICVWPNRLTLRLDDHAGQFELGVKIFSESSVILPGDEEKWPHSVQSNGQSVTLTSRDHQPALRLSSGSYTITGRFTWDKLPENLSIPDSGLIHLTVQGKTVAFPAFNHQGQLWIQDDFSREKKSAEISDSMSLRVHRKIVDTIPLRVMTHLDLDVSGKSRELLLEGALLPGFIPLELISSLPARVEADGRLRLQIRPGHWPIDLSARHPGNTLTLALPPFTEPWPSQEIWAFEAVPRFRIVEVEGVPTVDPRQTDLPHDWKSLPAYHLEPGSTMNFKLVRRGDPQPEADHLNLHRRLWLDFDGNGYTVNDRIEGRMTQDWRLNVLPSVSLGQVTIDGEPQLITRESPTNEIGIEVRRGTLNLSADSRIEEEHPLSAVGWNHDFRQVEAELNLPPGWRLWTVTGVDHASETWISSWTLLDLFMVLITVLAVSRLWGWPAAVFAWLALILLWQEPNAPQYSWLNLLAATALLKVLPAGRMAAIIRLYRNISWLVLILMAVPFIINQARLGLYPQLEQSWLVQESTDLAGSSEGEAAMIAEQKADAYPTAPIQEKPYRKRMMQDSRSDSLKSAQRQQIDPNAITQTGPGLPRWRWNTISLGWTGPVLQNQEVHFVLLSPGVNLVLNFLRIILLIGLALLFLQIRPKFRDSPPQDSHTDTFTLRVWEETNGADPSSSPPQPDRPHPPHSSPYTSAPGPQPPHPQRKRLLFKSKLKNHHQGEIIEASLLLLKIFFLLSLFFAIPTAQADYPDPSLLDELRSRLLAPPECQPRCAEITLLRIKTEPALLTQTLEIHAQSRTALPIPASVGQWLPSRAEIDGQPVDGLIRWKDGPLWLVVEAGIHTLTLSGPLPPREQLLLALPLKPHRVEASGSDWRVEGIGENGIPEVQLQLIRIAQQDRLAEPSPLETRPLPFFLEVERTLRFGLDWRITTIVRRITPTDRPIMIDLPLLEGESVITPGLPVKNAKITINLPPGQESLVWESFLEKRPTIRLQAAETIDWSEIWQADISPIWHLNSEGLVAVHHENSVGQWLPQWRPWPGEALTLHLTRPEGVPGNTLTIDRSQLNVNPGLRATDANLTVTLRSSQGGQHRLKLPENAILQSVAIDGQTQPIRALERQIKIPLHPGVQTAILNWRTETGLSHRFMTPEIDLGAPSVNASITLMPGRDRWLLLAGGSTLGPAILFWGILAVILLFSWILGRLPWAPLKTWQWSLLLVGLSQIPVAGGLIVIGWLLALGWRAEVASRLDRLRFNALQMGLAILSLLALILLLKAVEQGLLGLPKMQIVGNGSDAYHLNWYQDRSGPILPTPWIVSAPLWVYRLLMLAWALWLAYSLLDWLRWGWGCFGKDGLWRTKAISRKENT